MFSLLIFLSSELKSEHFAFSKEEGDSLLSVVLTPAQTICAARLLRACRWQQNEASLPVQPRSHNKRRKRKNDSFGSGSSSTALRDNTRTAFRLW